MFNYNKSTGFGSHASRLGSECAQGACCSAAYMQAHDYFPKVALSSHRNNKASFCGIPYHSMADFAETAFNSIAKGQ